MKLSRNKRDILDNRYVSYDPDQNIDGPHSLVDLCCPYHGPYQCPSEKLRQKYTWYSRRAPQCPGCREDKKGDKEYLDGAMQGLKTARGAAVWDETHPDWIPMSHWKVIDTSFIR